MKKTIKSLVIFSVLAGLLFGCSLPTPAQTANASTLAPVVSTPSVSGNNTATPEPALPVAQTEETRRAKYVFLFIGDGMGQAQITAARIFAAQQREPAAIGFGDLAFTGFESFGMINTFDAESYCPDSASAGTALATGRKTGDGIIAMDTGKSVSYKQITRYAKEAGYKIGVITSVSLNHATPACFYANQASRNQYYDIALQLVHSDFEYFGGGGFLQPDGAGNGKENILELAREAGYCVVDQAAAIGGLNAGSGKVIALAPEDQRDSDMSLPYEIDRRNSAAAGQPGISLADYVRSGISVLENEKGFFMLCEGGKIDWACHANDAAAAVWEVSAFSDAVQAAVDFAARHPGETLIVVTGDHETGGLSIGYAGTGHQVCIRKLGLQKISFNEFGKIVASMRKEKAGFEDRGMNALEQYFGFMRPDAADAGGAAERLTDDDYETLKKAFELSMVSPEKRKLAASDALAYGAYDPFTVTATHMLDNKSGLGWASYSHTGIPLPVYAQGVHAELFGGSYDNTEVFRKLMDAMGLTVK